MTYKAMFWTKLNLDQVLQQIFWNKKREILKYVDVFIDNRNCFFLERGMIRM